MSGPEHEKAIPDVHPCREPVRPRFSARRAFFVVINNVLSTTGERREACNRDPRTCDGINKPARPIPAR